MCETARETASAVRTEDGEWGRRRERWGLREMYATVSGSASVASLSRSAAWGRQHDARSNGA